jgi:phosphoketolase
MVLLPVYEAKDELEKAGVRVRIVSVVNPRRLYRPTDVAWDTVAEADGMFLSDDGFRALFHGDALIAVTGGASAMLEPLLLRSQAPSRELFSWKRGETTASPREIMEYNGMSGAAMAFRAQQLLKA